MTSDKSQVEVLQPAFQIGETVYSAIADDRRGMVTGIHLRPGYIAYDVTWADDSQEDSHFIIELSREPPYRMPTR